MGLRVKKNAACGLLVCLCALFLFGCAQDSPNVTTQPTETTIPKYTVTFMAGDEVYAALEVESGGYTAVDEPAIAGQLFYGWQDQRGNAAAPESTMIQKDITFYAVLFPDLSSHAPYLFADADLFLHPDEALTADALAAAVEALATVNAKGYLPELPEGGEIVSSKQLEKLLQQLFPEEMVLQAMDGYTGDTLTRADFALIMNALLNRNAERAAVAEEVQIARDLPMTHVAYYALLEASLPHTHADSEISWNQVAVAHKAPVGFFNVDGWLYYIGEQGAIVRDTEVGELTFGVDGRFTCGDAELDAMVAGILADICTANPDAERIDLLRRGFEYSRDSFKYLRRSSYYFGQTGWEIEDAKKMISTGRGNCYSYAAVFWALARGLGYEAIAISGTMTGTDQPHSWVEIFFDGTPYIFDPEMEMVYRTERDIFDKDMFMVTYARGTYWNYKRP